MTKYYEVGRWKGYRRWQCLLCPFDTTAANGEEVIKEHIDKVHRKHTRRIEEVVLPLVDARGSRIVKRVIIDDVIGLSDFSDEEE